VSDIAVYTSCLA